jgi:hypothetical protein
VRLCDVSFHDADGRSRSGWWAKVDLPNARIDMGAPTSVPGKVDARARDVGFPIDLFGSGRGYPRWMDRLVDSGEAHARGRVYWRADTLMLDAVHAGNDRYEVMTRLRLAGAIVGQMFARSGGYRRGSICATDSTTCT